MFLLKEGRDDYLAFVRNIPSQGLLGFIGIVFFHGGLHGHPSVQTAVAGCIACAMAVLAAINSSVNFFEAFQNKRIAPGKANALAAHPRIDAPFEARLVGTAKRLWTQKWVVAEAMVIILLMDWACASAAIQAGYMALSAIHGAAAK